MTALKEQLEMLKPDWARFDVQHAWLFGSRATGKAAPDSDWDFLVQFSRPPGFEEFMGLRDQLANRLGARVDLLSRSACKSRFLKEIENELIDVT